jgi:preprotein translocase subunit SecD
MKTLRELLQAADPLEHESARNIQERRASRQLILEATRGRRLPSHRRTAMMSIAAAIVVAAMAGALHRSRATVDVIAAVRLEIRLAETRPAPGLREAVMALSGDRIYIHEDAVVLTNSDIVQANVVPGSTPSTFSITVTFTRDGSSRMYRATQEHIGRPIAILIDGQVVAAPVVRSAISASAVISGNFTRAEGDRIVAGIIGR